MRSTIRLGRIAGIEVGIHWSLLVIAFVLVGSLAGAQFPAIAPRAHGSYLAAALLAVALFFGSILAHELAHSIVARRQGQTVSGITLWLLGGVSKLGSDAKDAGDEFRVAVAGPATSLGLAAGFGAGWLLFRTVSPGTLLPIVAGWLSVVNLVLGVFNLLPGAPLDGGRVLASLLWMRRGDRRSAQISAARAGRVLGTILVAGSLGLLFFGADTFLTALVGLFVLTASRQEESSARLLRALDGHPIGELMRPLPRVVVPEWTTVAVFGPVREPTLLAGWDGRPTAYLPADAVFAVPPEAREHVQLRALAVPLTQFSHTAPERDAVEVVTHGLPAIVDDAEGRPIGVFGLDELKVAAQRDPALARLRA